MYRHHEKPYPKRFCLIGWCNLWFYGCWCSVSRISIILWSRLFVSSKWNMRWNTEDMTGSMLSIIIIIIIIGLYNRKSMGINDTVSLGGITWEVKIRQTFIFDNRCVHSYSVLLSKTLSKLCKFILNKSSRVHNRNSISWMCFGINSKQIYSSYLP